jgi:hypothetical protein
VLGSVTWPLGRDIVPEILLFELQPADSLSDEVFDRDTPQAVIHSPCIYLLSLERGVILTGYNGGIIQFAEDFEHRLTKQSNRITN